MTTPRKPVPASPSARPVAPAVTTDLFSRAIPFLYERHAFGEHKKTSMARVEVATEGDEVKPDKSYLSLQKRLLQMPELNAIKQHDAVFRGFLKNEAATPWRPGLYLVPTGLVTAVSDRALAWETQRTALAKIAADAYEDQVLAMQAKLGPLYNASDYPTVQRFLAQFWVSWRFIDMGVPATLKTIKAEVFEREKAKVVAEGQRAMAAIQKHLRVTLLEITEHLAGLLQPKADGKARAIRDEALDDINTFLDTIRLRDVTGDTALQQVCKTLKGLGKGLDVESLRDDKDLRTATAAVVETVKSQLEGLVVSRSRGIRIREEV